MATTPNSTANVSVGKGVAGGYFFTAPEGTTLPTDYSTALDNAFVNCGYLTDEGAVFSVDSSSTNFLDLNGDTIASSTGSRTRTVNVVFAETNVNSLKEVYGQSNVTATTTAITVNHNGTEMGRRSLVFELVLRDGRRWRRVIPSAQVTEWDDMTVLYSELVNYPVTYTMYKDAAGNDMYDYIQLSA